MLLGTCLVVGSRSNAETKNYESKSSTGFYGVYEYPKEGEKPLPETTEKEVTSKPAAFQTVDGKVITLLPQTGDQPYWLTGSYGLLMIGLGIYLSFKKQHERRL